MSSEVPPPGELITMRKYGLIIAACVLALAAAACADFGSVVYSWDIPTQNPRYDIGRGLAYHGDYIWCSVDLGVGSDTIFKCIPSTGSAVASFTHPFRTGHRGMTYRRYQNQDVLEIAVLQYGQMLIARVNFRGEVVERVNVNLPGNATFNSIYFDGTNDWVLRPDIEYNILYKLNASGVPVSSIRVNDVGSGRGLTKQGDFFWMSADYTTPPGFFGCAKLNANGSLVASFENSYQTVCDCTYENNHVWFVGQSHKVYCVDVSNAPAVLPASVGRIKALFR